MQDISAQSNFLIINKYTKSSICFDLTVRTQTDFILGLSAGKFSEPVKKKYPGATISEDIIIITKGNLQNTFRYQSYCDSFLMKVKRKQTDSFCSILE